MTSFGVHLRGPDGDARKFGDLCSHIEQWGFNSVWMADGLTRAAPEPFPALAYASSFTTTVKLGTSVYIVPVRHPLVTAKLTATLDQISGGRFILGVGVGWREDEFTSTGIPFQQRGKVTDECLEIISQAWSNGKVNFEGSFFRIKGVKMELQPVQRPRPPVWIGGNGKPAALRAAKFGDYWFPTDYTLEEYEQGDAMLADACKKANRTRAEVKVASHLMTIIDRDKHRAEELAKEIADSLGEKVDELKKWALVGDPSEVSKRLEAYNNAGVDYHVLNFGTKMRDEERIELFAKEVLPSFT